MSPNPAVGVAQSPASFVYSDTIVRQIVSYIISHTLHLYFHGYTLTSLILQEFFSRFQSFAEHGFCFMVAAINMIAFRDNLTSRIVYAYCKKDRRRHAWLEFCIDGTWWVLDPCWFTPGIRQRDDYYSVIIPDPFYICDHDEFWSYPLSFQMEQKMQQPATSHLFFEFWEYYSWYDGCDRPFDPKIATTTLEEENGRHLHPGLFLFYPEIVLSRRIINEFMARPQRKQPKAHTLRKIARFRKLIARDYHEFCEAKQRES